MSMTSTFSGPQATLLMKESKADMTMGPLQTAGASACTALQVLAVSSQSVLTARAMDTRRGALR